MISPAMGASIDAPKMWPFLWITALTIPLCDGRHAAGHYLPDPILLQ